MLLRPYLYISPFKIRKDHLEFHWNLNMKEAAEKLEIWSLYIFELEI